MDAEVQELRAENERLLLIAEALWRIIRDKLQVEEHELAKQIVAIDMEDGRFDGRKAPSAPRPCSKCGRILAKHRPRCLFCGEPVTPEPFER